jgi:hypothetical protein
MFRKIFRALPFLVVGILTSGLGNATAQETAEGSAPPAVRLIVDYGDGVQKHFTQLVWSEKMTVQDAVRAAEQHPRGIKTQQRGRGSTAFLTQIDDLKNEGRGRNWVYSVNDKLADRSFAIFALQAGDTVLWRFGEYR